MIFFSREALISGERRLKNLGKIGNNNVGAYHPNFWKFIDILKREQNLIQVNIAQARAGHQPEPQRRRYLDSNQRIKNIVQDYHNRDIMQYLRGLAHNISM